MYYHVHVSLAEINFKVHITEEPIYIFGHTSLQVPSG
jgi:hypothetical protein